MYVTNRRERAINSNWRKLYICRIRRFRSAFSKESAQQCSHLSWYLNPLLARLILARFNLMRTPWTKGVYIRFILPRSKYEKDVT
ncbi:hypothetical protein TA5113_02596 [Cognatishimia activa]|nr:hypothetical protein TA5113_02596 [Cognatishimia activa]